jgi:hypothetical protein
MGYISEGDVGAQDDLRIIHSRVEAPHRRPRPEHLVAYTGCGE